MLDEAHRPFLVSWDRLGDEADDDGGQVFEHVVARAWACSCGWRGAVRSVDDRFFRPLGDVEGRLRGARVRREDRATRSAWDGHARPDDEVTAGSQSDLIATGSVSAPGAPAPRGVEADPGGTGGAPGPLVRSARAERARLRQQSREAQASLAASTAASERAPDVVRGVVEPEAAAVEVAGPAEEIARAAVRMENARGELAAAEAALSAAVGRARLGGLSWRAVATASGVDHRRARARWEPDDTTASP